MSLGANLIKGAAVVGLMFGIGSGASNLHAANQAHDNNTATLKRLDASYAAELKKRPTVKRVETNYQRALTTAKAYLAQSDALHQFDQASGHTNTTARSQIVDKMNSHVLPNSKTSTSLQPALAENWHTKIIYGGQTGTNRILMSYQMFNKKNVLMGTTLFYYNLSSNKLSGFMSYQTNAGRVISQKSVMTNG